jgi:hypothetical protein
MAAGDNHTEKQLELLSTWVDDLATENQKFQQYSKANIKTTNK